MEFFAHRGLSGAAPENTAAAFQLGQSHGLLWTELDVLFTADDVPVICHDDGLQRFGHDLSISEQPWSALRHLDMGSWFDPDFADQTLLTLADALALLAPGQTGVNIELKPELYGRLSGPRSLALTRQFAAAEAQGLQLLLSSFDPRLVNWCRQHCPETPRAVLVEGPLTRAHEQLAELAAASALHIEDPHTRADDIHRIKALGLASRVYTVNDPQRARTLASWGCDGIFTDLLSPEVIR